MSVETVTVDVDPPSPAATGSTVTVDVSEPGVATVTVNVG